jgi:hypothetical protein
MRRPAIEEPPLDQPGVEPAIVCTASLGSPPLVRPTRVGRRRLLRAELVERARVGSRRGAAGLPTVLHHSSKE